MAEAIVEVDELSKIESKNPGHWFNFARLCAIASLKIEGRKAEFADRAVELLRKAVVVGYKNPTRLAGDADLAPLRNRDEFKHLFADLEMNFPQKLEKAPLPREKK